MSKSRKKTKKLAINRTDALLALAMLDVAERERPGHHWEVQIVVGKKNRTYDVFTRVDDEDDREW